MLVITVYYTRVHKYHDQSYQFFHLMFPREGVSLCGSDRSIDVFLDLLAHYANRLWVHSSLSYSSDNDGDKENVSP